MDQSDSRLLKSIWCVLKQYHQVCYFLSFVDEDYCTDSLIFMNRVADLCSTTVTVPPDQRNNIQRDFCTVLLTCCVAFWTNCWLCDSVQKYCCTVTSGDFVNWAKSNCSQLSSPPLAHQCHYHNHIHHKETMFYGKLFAKNWCFAGNNFKFSLI